MRAATRPMPRLPTRGRRLNLLAGEDPAGIEQGPDLASPDMAMAAFIMALRAAGLRRTGLLAAFERVPRRSFVRDELSPHLYADIALPLEGGEQATSPHQIARALNLAGLEPGMSVLEIGTGSGYQTALLAMAGCHVTSLERLRVLTQSARRAIKTLVITADVRLGDGLDPADLPSGRFDRIFVNGSLDPDHCAWNEWRARLPETGMLVAPILHLGLPHLATIDRSGTCRVEPPPLPRIAPVLKRGRAQSL